MTDPQQGRQPREGYVIAVVATLVMTVSYVDRQTLAALAPTVRPALGLTQTEYGFITGAFSIAYLVCSPLAGALLDRAGVRRVIAIAVTLWSLVAACHALLPTAHGFAALFALRVLLGAAESPSFPAAANTMRRVLPARHRGAGYGLLFTGSSIGGMIVAPIAIGLQTLFGWRLAFLLTAAIAFAWVPGWLYATRAAKELDAKDTGHAAARLTRADAGPIVRALVLVALSAPAIMFVLNWYPQVLRDAFSVPQKDLWRYLWLPLLFFDAGSVGFGAIAGARASGERRDLVLVAALLCLALALVPSARAPWIATMLASVAMLGGGALYSLSFGELAARVRRERLGAAGGLCAAAQSLAHVIAAPLIGRGIDAAHGSYDRALVVLAVCSLPGALAWISWPARLRAVSDR